MNNYGHARTVFTRLEPCCFVTTFSFFITSKCSCTPVRFAFLLTTRQTLTSFHDSHGFHHRCQRQQHEQRRRRRQRRHRRRRRRRHDGENSHCPPLSWHWWVAWRCWWCRFSTRFRERERRGLRPSAPPFLPVVAQLCCSREVSIGGAVEAGVVEFFFWGGGKRCGVLPLWSG